MAEITVNFVEQPITVEIDIARLTWRDLVALQKARQAGMDEEQAIQTTTELVSKVVGEDAWEMPAQVVARVVQEMMARVGAGAEAKN